MTVIKKHEELKQKANKIVRDRTLYATGGGGIPIPFVDTAVVLGIQLFMLRDLAELYQVPFKKHVAKSLISSLVSNLTVIGTIKLIPIVGTIIGSITYGLTSGAITYALGKLFTQHFDQGGTLLSFDPVKSRKYFQEYYQEGTTFLNAQHTSKATVAELQQANDNLRLTIASLQNQLDKNHNALQTKVITQPPTVEKRNWGRIAIILLLLLAISSGIAWFFYSTSDNKEGHLETPVLDSLVNEVGEALGEANILADSSAIVQSLEESLPENTDLAASALGFTPNTTEGQMADYLLDENALIPKTFVLTGVNFSEGLKNIDETGQQHISNIAKLMENYPNLKVRIYGHTDSGDKVIGRERAKAIKTILTNNGVNRRNVISSIMNKPATAKKGAEIEIINR